MWSVLDTLFQLTVVAVAVAALLATNTVNVWLSSGLGVLVVTSRFSHVAFRLLKNRIQPALAVRLMLIGFVVAAALCGIGSILVGGLLGWLGVFLCLRFGLWPLRALYRLSVRGDKSAVFDYEQESQWLISLYVVAPLLFIVFGIVFFG